LKGQDINIRDDIARLFGFQTAVSGEFANDDDLLYLDEDSFSEVAAGDSGRYYYPC
jgi:hypothetical protein